MFQATKQSFRAQLQAFLINQLRGKATMLFIAHALPKNLQVDEIVRIGAGTSSAVGEVQEGRRPEAEG